MKECKNAEEIKELTNIEEVPGIPGKVIEITTMGDKQGQLTGKERKGASNEVNLLYDSEEKK